jgi:hypothetical protein
VSGGIVRIALLTAVLAVAVSGCGGGDDAATPLGSGAGGGTTAPTSAAATTTPGSGLPATTVTMRPVGAPTGTDKAVLEGYRKFWQALGTAYTTGDVTALRAATTEPATGTYVKVAADLRKQQRTLQGPVTLAPIVAGRAGTVTLADCADLRRFRTYDNTGKALFPEDKDLTTAEVKLRNVGGTWRVVSFEERPSGCRQQGG